MMSLGSGVSVRAVWVVQWYRLLGLLFCSYAFLGILLQHGAWCSSPVDGRECDGHDCNKTTGSAGPATTEGVEIVDDSPRQANATQEAPAANSPEHPIFMVPGIAGSGLMVSTKNASLPLCAASPVSSTVPFRLWASLSLIRPPRSHQLCWMDMMQPVSDEKGEHYSSKDGVVVEVDSYGTAHGFDYLDYYYNERFGVPGTAYFHTMLRTFYSMGYMDFDRLKSQIEHHVEAMGGAKADLLVHSLGSIVCNYFLNKVVDKRWKDKYINSYTLVAPATGGSFKAIKAILTGYNDPVDLTFWTLLDISLIPVDVLRDLARSLGSIYALLPDIDLYGKDHLVLRQLLPKSGTRSPAFSALAEGQDGGGPSAMMNSGRSLEFRRLAESDAGASIQELADKSEKNGDEEHRMNPQEQQVGEQLVQDAIDAQVKQRTLQLHQYVENARERMAAVERLEATEDLNEVVYTLGNWTTLLEPELRARAETARERMKGVLEDPGVPTRCIWSVFGFPSTDVGYIYTGTDLSRKPIPVLDVGDDTVPLRSLSVCTGWSSTFEVKTFKNLDHMFIFGDGEFNSYIQVAFGKPKEKSEMQEALELST
ncbi:1-O-acylceramide synthase, putative [Eimeria necatrix]|uniref:1-O-acylceramide synthase, putative n=1 Tax=Eimeria necatrix TaxID=51315 RepID=U6MVY3_9EIME|nr:1-O-acylceramide synthase, putative [Eimeria necatrix]CDJ65885.1 1-O-acylceramide synthase, putative [Eimeria necatrix]